MFIQRECLLFKPLVFVCALTLLSSCRQESFSSPDGYDLNEPAKMALGKTLNEISGIFFNENTGNLVSVSDSRRHVIEIDPKNLKLKDFTDKVVPPDSDLEDIVMVNDVIYLLSSKGMIVEVNRNRKDSGAIVNYQINLPEPNDFETLYYDPTARGLVMMCKSCAVDKGQKQQSAFRFDLATKTFDSTAFFTVSKDAVKDLLKDDDAKFDPSAAAIHPVNKRLYILSSAGNLLVVADTRGQVVESYKLNPDLYPQAEGIAFAPNGGMFISNEGKFGKPTLYYFSYQPHSKTRKK